MAGQNVEIFKPKLDTRYSDEDVVSHNQNKIRSTAVENPSEILLLASNCHVVGIDEAQFFDESIVDIANQLANGRNKSSYCRSGYGFSRKTFRTDAQSDGNCRICNKSTRDLRRTGNLANYSMRTSAGKDLVELGETESYDAVSRRVFVDEVLNKKEI